MTNLVNKTIVEQPNLFELKSNHNVQWLAHLTQSKCKFDVRNCSVYGRFCLSVFTLTFGVNWFPMTAAAACFLCLRKFSYFVINRIIMQQQQQSIAFNLRAHRSVWVRVCVFVHACMRQRQIGRLCAMEWSEWKNKNGEWVSVCMRWWKKWRQRAIEGERKRKRNVCYTQRTCFCSLSRWLKHIVSFRFSLFLSPSQSHSFHSACGCAVRCDVSIPRNLNHKFYGLVFFLVGRPFCNATQYNKSKRPQLFYIFASYGAV